MANPSAVGVAAVSLQVSHDASYLPARTTAARLIREHKAAAGVKCIVVKVGLGWKVRYRSVGVLQPSESQQNMSLMFGIRQAIYLNGRVSARESLRPNGPSRDPCNNDCETSQWGPSYVSSPSLCIRALSHRKRAAMPVSKPMFHLLSFRHTNQNYVTFPLFCFCGADTM